MALSHRSFRSQETTFTASGLNSEPIDLYGVPANHYALFVKSTGGTPTSWIVYLQGSIENSGTDFETILTHDTVFGITRTKYSGANVFPNMRFRVRCQELTLGGATSITVVALGIE